MAWVVTGFKGLDGVTVIKFKKTDDAKKYATKMGVLVDLGEKEVYRTGSILMIGTAQGIKDAK